MHKVLVTMQGTPQNHVLHMLSRNGRVIMIIICIIFRGCTKSCLTFSKVVGHIFYIVGLAGCDHIRIEGDFGGIAIFTNGLENVACHLQLI
jgi:microsomal dipeptidase-like Zn-dependent dipeptidase